MNEIRYLLDENVNPILRSALLRNEPNLTVWQVGMLGAPELGTLDPEILIWCEVNGFILVTNNRQSMPVHLEDHLATGRHAAGIFILNAEMSAPTGALANYGITNAGATFTIGAWTLNGFYPPIGVLNTYHLLIPPMSGIVWNSIKGGQTVPLKFNIFAGATEQTNVAAVAGFSIQQVNCVDVGTTLDDVDFVTSGATMLRYDGTPGSGGQFIQNWKTPSGVNLCYRTVMTATDGSVLVAFFKTKK